MSDHSDMQGEIPHDGLFVAEERTVFTKPRMSTLDEAYFMAKF
jgi:hypothetical protein